MNSDIIVLCLYLSFVLDFIVWPIPSEVSTYTVVTNENKRGHWSRYLLIFLHLCVLVLWVLPALASLASLLGIIEQRESLVIWLGVLLALSGRAMTISGSLSLRKHGFSSVISRGVFSSSRHPILVGLHICLAGFLLTLQIGWLLLPYLMTLVYFHRKVLKEESNLHDRFGEAYQAYCLRTPRYLLVN